MSEEMMQTSPFECPAWFDGKKINETVFCEEFLRDYPMVTVNDAFFTVNGRVHDENRLKKVIYDRIKYYVTSGVAKKVTNLLDVMRMECCTAKLSLYQDRIHVANGTYYLNGTFSPEKDFCRNRLPVAYNPDAPQPVTWLHFLSQLLEPEDILTLQEFMGYCFIPSTKGQKMLLLIGKGGEGKSRIGIVLRALLGSNMNTGSIAKVETSPFARADLEHELVMLDDDMKLEALPQTNNIKAIITAELPMDLEKKGQQSYQGDLYVRFIGLGNGVLQSLYDRSVGFFRRQIILSTKEKDPNRKDDPYIAEKMCAEAEGIFLWALEGLHRLIDNDYKFILRFAKYKGPEISGIEAHNERTKEKYASNPDIDPSRTHLNFHLIKPERKYRAESECQIAEAGCRTRSDSVRVVEALITATPEFFKGKKRAEIREFFNEALEFIKQNQAPETIISAVVHLDEKSPHMHLCFVPLTEDKRLCAKEILGNKKKLTQWQDKYWEHMVKKYPDLERGESASETGRDHIPTRVFKQMARLNKQHDKLAELLSDMKFTNYKERSAQIAAFLEKYIPDVAAMETQMKKYKKFFKTADGKQKALEKKNDELTAALEKSEKESTVKKLQEMRLHSDYERIKGILDRIPPEIIRAYTHRDSKTQEVRHYR